MTEKTKFESSGIYLKAIEDKDNGKIPMPEHVEEDESPIEICRVWKLSDDSIFNVTLPYELDSSTDWGVVLAGIARALASGIAAQADEGEKERTEASVTNGIVSGFLHQLGVKVAIVPAVCASESNERVLDPDKAN